MEDIGNKNRKYQKILMKKYIIVSIKSVRKINLTLKR